MSNQTNKDTHLWFGSLTSDFGHSVCVTTQTVYLCFRPHVPHLFAHKQNFPVFNFFRLIKQII